MQRRIEGLIGTIKKSIRFDRVGTKPSESQIHEHWQHELEKETKKFADQIFNGMGRGASRSIPLVRKTEPVDLTSGSKTLSLVLEVLKDGSDKHGGVVRLEFKFEDLDRNPYERFIIFEKNGPNLKLQRITDRGENAGPKIESTQLLFDAWETLLSL